MELIGLFISLFKALILTVIIEGAVMILMTRDKDKLKHSVYCNLMTNPLLNLIGLLVFNIFSYKAYIIYVAVGELIVFVSEAKLYGLFGEKSAKKAYLMSFAANMCSFLSGLILNHFDLI
ncbi:MAG: hypothetical protein K6G68_03955 [Oscillospiraceae bacterium]|jgi:hypothetical protein|nr:hypothetical protein [Oscillospiraceae bacterium]MCR5806170.1 hypothetical protein [Oscillospiraceae bacterium]